jgi:isopentenyl diphosphate isomerase/L-lactate dehydrogenase-like FMN-dependent dehydrogenase
MLAKQALRRPVALGAARACSSQATSGRPGARAEEMEKAADKVQSGKNAWQKTVGGIVDAVRPITSALAPTIMPILDAPYQRGVRNAVNIDDLQAVAERRAHAMVYGYLAGGADAERSLRRSVAAFNDVELRHAVLHGVGHNDMDMRTTILGHEAQLPFFVTSCAGQRMFHADGEVATAKAAKKHGCFMALSQLTTSTFEDVREAHPDGAKCLQLYVWRDRVLLKEVLDRAKAVGFTSLALTADFSWVGNRERETKTGFTVPPSYSVRQCIDAIKSPAWTYDYMSRVPYGYKAVPDADFPAESLVDFIAAQMKPEFDWKDAEWLCSEWGDTGPVALKGVASGEDAKQAMETGFGAVWVSNHGGRQLEDSVATFDVLPEVRKAVGPDVEVILDGGVRRGIDVVKAIARGADSVACGRAYLFGLAAGGFNGVDKSLSLLSRDLYLAMGLLGCRSVAELKEKAPLALKKADPWGEQFPGKSM